MPAPLSKQPEYEGNASSDRIARFGPFELNLDTPELRRQGKPVSMRQQSLRILTYLVQHAGTTVGREELRAAVWPSGTYIEFESGLYTAVNQMRRALGDSASTPHFIETVPKVGYRFISPVQIEAQTISGAEQRASQPATAAGFGVKTRERAPHRRAAWLLIVSVALGVVLSVTITHIWRNRARSGPPIMDHLRPFTTGPGKQDHLAFSPNGEMAAFDWQSPSDTQPRIYVQRLDATTPARLTKAVDQDTEERPVWSPDGQQVAFLRDDDGPTLAIITTPLSGRGEKKWLEFRKGATPWFDWSRDGKWFVIAEPNTPGNVARIVLISPTTGERRVLTQPHADWRGDSLPTFSPDSKEIAFRRTLVQSGEDDLYEVAVTGDEPRRITHNNRVINAFSFTPDAGLLISAKLDSSLRTLWWMGPDGGNMSRLTAPVFDATAPAVSRDGKHIAFSKVLLDVNVWSVNADGQGAARELIDSRLPDIGAQYSPDGRRIVFQSTRSGNDDLWTCDANGGNTVRLVGGGGAPIGNARWSPDGRRIAFEWHPTGKAEIYVIAAEGRAPQKLVANDNQNSMPSWSHDGRFLYFSSIRAGARSIWKVRAEGGAPIQISDQPGFAPVEAADGGFLYYFRDAPNDGEVWRQPLRDGAPAGDAHRVVTGMRHGDWGNWAIDSRGIYYLEPQQQNWVLEYHEFSTGAVRTVYRLRNPPIWASSGLAISPDGKTILFAQVDQDDSNIFLQ